MASIFLSYARRDEEFARQLAEVLAEHGHTVWVDWKDIGPAAEWRAAIVEAIDSADAFIPVLTPDWATASTCMSEADLAVERGKRIIPVLRRQLDPSAGRVDQSARHVYERAWVPFGELDDPEDAVRALLEAIDTDPDWAREHSRLLERAAEWERNGRDRSYLLRGNALAVAERWLARGPATRSPAPTPLQMDYLVASRRQARLRRPRRPRRNGIFISYRREDSLASAGRLHDRLSALVGERRVFMDVNSLRPGVDFVVALEEALDETGVLLAMVGVEWLGARQPDGRRRLESPTDFVRLEIEGALARGIAVIPVLLDGAPMPRREELPPTLAELVRRQSFELRHERWQRDVEDLLTALPSDVLPIGTRFRLRRKS